MSNKTGKFTIFVPGDQEPERKLPARLEIDDSMAPKVGLPAGAYDPYQKPVDETPQMRIQKKKDLRKLSEWIKLKREVEELARVNEAPLPDKEG